MKSLVIWGSGPLALARRRVMEGARLVAWDAPRGEALIREGIACATRAECLSREDREAVDRSAVAWTKSWRQRPLLDGRSFQELLVWDRVSLWWFAELYLHHSTGAARRVRLIETFYRLLQREAPDEVEAVGLGDEACLLLERTATAQRILLSTMSTDPPSTVSPKR